MEAALIDTQALELAERDFREAVERVEELRQVRNEMVRTAIDQDWTHAQIATATGLTRTRIGQIALMRPERPRKPRTTAPSADA